MVAGGAGLANRAAADTLVLPATADGYIREIQSALTGAHAGVAAFVRKCWGDHPPPRCDQRGHGCAHLASARELSPNTQGHATACCGLAVNWLAKMAKSEFSKHDKNAQIGYLLLLSRSETRMTSERIVAAAKQVRSRQDPSAEKPTQKP